MGPPQGSGDTWRSEALRQVDGVCDARHKRDARRLDDLEEADRDIRKELRDHYVTKTELKLQLEKMEERYDKTVKIVDKAMWTIVLAVLGALLTLVIQHGSK